MVGPTGNLGWGLAYALGLVYHTPEGRGPYALVDAPMLRPHLWGGNLWLPHNA